MARKDMSETRKGFSQRFNEALRSAGLHTKSFAQLSPLFDTSRQTIFKWLHKDVYPSVLSAKLICEQLDVSFEWLMLGEGLMGRSEKPSLKALAISKIFENLTPEGQRRLLKSAFVELMDFEIQPRTKVENQSALKLIAKSK